MLWLSFTLLLLAALLGTALATLHPPTESAAPPSWPFGILHGMLGLAGLVALMLALRGSPRGAAAGVGAFGRIAAALLAAALLAGSAILLAHLRDARIPAVVIGVHAVLAISGIVVLAAYIFVG